MFQPLIFQGVRVPTGNIENRGWLFDIGDEYYPTIWGL